MERSQAGQAHLANEASTREWAARALAPLVKRAFASENGALVTLDGPLGAGKSALARALLRAAGVSGPVPSPTYTLVEPYHAGGVEFLHLDLYRLSDPDELALLGIDALRSRGTIALVEWSSRLPDALGRPDLSIELAYVGTSRQLQYSWHETADGVVIQ